MAGLSDGARGRVGGGDRGDGAGGGDGGAPAKRVGDKGGRRGRGRGRGKLGDIGGDGYGKQRRRLRRETWLTEGLAADQRVWP